MQTLLRELSRFAHTELVLMGYSRKNTHPPMDGNLEPLVGGWMARGNLGRRGEMFTFIGPVIHEEPVR